MYGFVIHRPVPALVQASDASGFIATPGDILAFIEKVDSAASTLNGDILASPLLFGDPSWSAAWVAWFGNWKKFVKDHESWTSRLSGTVWDQTEDYERQFNDYRAQFIRKGGKTGAPVSNTGSSGGLPSLSDISNLIVVAALAYLAITHLK